MSEVLQGDIVALLDVPTFSRPDVAPIVGITDGQLKGILDRKLVQLQTHNPGSGHPRLFSGSDVFKIAVANAMAFIGIPMRHLGAYAGLVDNRARELLPILQQLAPDSTDLSDEELLRRLPEGFRRDVWWMLFPIDDREGTWALHEFHKDFRFAPELWPVAYSVLRVDEIIMDTMRRLAAFERGEVIPERKVIAKLRESMRTDTDGTAE